MVVGGLCTWYWTRFGIAHTTNGRGSPFMSCPSQTGWLDRVYRRLLTLAFGCWLARTDVAPAIQKTSR